ncbi:MAG: hypothetical protein NTY53_12235 [Kiritimatiellaeota bacterium]|nr:hypothetical protein [Kiritimatiellota bacterium]
MKIAKIRLCAGLLGVVFPMFGKLCAADFQALENCGGGAVKLLFSTTQDITNTWGQLHFGVTPLQLVTNCANPGFELSCCLPRADGAWDVYGQTFKQVSAHKDQVRETNAWSVVHATTRDGVRFENIETVFNAEPGPWTFNHAMAYNQ